MLAREYEFNTGVKGIMEIVGGEMKIKRLSDSDYISFSEGTEFVVPANSSF